MSRYAVSDLHGNYNLWQQINNFIKPEDTLFVLGDCADRGPDGWAIIKEVIDMPNSYYIRGNHEQMLLDRNFGLWAYNGGRDTIAAWDNEVEELKAEVYATLKETVLRVDLLNDNNQVIHLTHAGFDPCGQVDEDDYLWDRYHLAHMWFGDDNEFVIHGHTPVQYMEELAMEKNMKNTNAFWYADGHKCCIDMGTFMSGKTILLDLDTFEEIVFEEKEWQL